MLSCQGDIGEKIEGKDIIHVLKMRLTSFFAHKRAYQYYMRIIFSLTQTIDLSLTIADESLGK